MDGQLAETLQAPESTLTAEKASFLKQPKAVWATALAAVFAFMGIGLVDPILPAIATNLDASPSQVSLLFTSYFLVTALAMLITGFVSSRIGGKRTLLIGLAVIVVFSSLSGLSGSVDELVGFRAGWGLGNALFVATALAVIVGVASGGAGTAIILYEAALGLGISLGPLLGALLGGWQWRAPFFGTAVLMAAAFIALIALLPRTPLPERKVRLRDPCWRWATRDCGRRRQAACSTTTASSPSWLSPRSSWAWTRTASAASSLAGVWLWRYFPSSLHRSCRPASAR
ncbi:MFS transporter [Arthrobacter sp. FX8]|uniref:MFS transporter n=1 Tax=Arthrobacter sp. FX8 TaxID=2997335 RepID=UPI002DD6789D|nr:MFS transporter [Arthrobacter sp. FX8]